MIRDDIERIAATLREAEAATTAVGPVSDLVEGGLSLDQAHAICEANVVRREAAGERLAGYKVGFTNVAVRERMGLPDPTYGYLFDSMIMASGSSQPMDTLIAPKIESEICVRLGSDLAGPGVTARDVLVAADAVRGSFEICDARILDWTCPYADFFADNGFSARIVLGELDWVPIGDVDVLEETVVIAKDGVPFAEGRGELAMGSPLEAVAWLANKLAERGRSLHAGDLVMTGTLTPITPMERGASYSATFSTLGTVRTTT
jgi:2-keto-4-pentenoate hydratase